MDAGTSTIAVTWGSNNAPGDIATINSAIKTATDTEATLTGDITLSIDGGATFAAVDLNGKASSFSSVQLWFGGVFYVQHLLPLDGHVFREEHGQIAWGKTIDSPKNAISSFTVEKRKSLCNAY